MDLSHIPIVDHHAHPLLHPRAVQELTHFQRWFTESIDPDIHRQHVPHGLFFRTAIRWLADLLQCDPTPEAVLAARTEQPQEAWIRRLFDDANIEVVLCDYGFGGAQRAPQPAPGQQDGQASAADSEVYGHAQMQGLLARRVEPILRLETLAEDLTVQHDTFAAMVEAYAETVSRAREYGYVALKSIIAYRSGLDVGPPDREAAMADFDVLRAESHGRKRPRLARKALCDYLLHRALEQARQNGLPVQLHTGFGDRDADLRLANPLHLRSIIEAYPAVRLVLLHGGWPYYRELAHLAAIYSNVWLDLSLAIPFATVGIPTMLRDVLGMTPISKMLFATDAFTMPEIYWLAACWGRWGLGKVLDELVAEDFLRHDEALLVAQDILGENARRLYL